MNQTLIVPIIALVVGGSTGFFIGNSRSTTPLATDVSETTIIQPPSKVQQENRTSEQRSSVNRAKALRSSDKIFREGSQTSRVEELISFYSQLDSHEFEAEVDKLTDISMPDRMLASYLLFSQWAELDPIRAIAKTDNLGRMGVFSKSTVLRSWASTDPQSAANFYLSNKDDFTVLTTIGRNRRGSGMSPSGSIAGEWAKEDPKSALVWATAQEGTDNQQAIGSVFTELAKTDPQQAAILAANLAAESQQTANLSIARTLGANDYEAAQTWISTLPTEAQEQATLTALESLAGKNPSQAATLLGEVSGEENKLNLIDDIATGYARSDGAAGVEFLINTANLEAIEQSINDPMRTWVANDPEKARDYALAIEQGPARDTTLRSYIIVDRTNNDFQGQLDLATTIQNESDRGDAYNVVMNRFVRSDEDAAREYLKQDPNISPEQQEEIIKGAKNNRRRGGFRGR